MSGAVKQPRGNGWDEYQQLVLSELESHGDQLKKLDTRLWLLVVGYIPTLIFSILQFVSR